MRTALGAVLLCSVLALPVLGQELLSVQDLGFQRKPFNPGDAGVIQRVALTDNDAGNRDDVYLTKLTLENLGTATDEEIVRVEVRLESNLGSFVLAAADSFPIVKVLLPLPVEQRTIPDDTRAILTVWVQVGDNLTDGHTIQPKVHLWFSEHDDGGEAEATDTAPETLVMEGSFTARALSGPEGGVLNPGDAFPVMEFQVEDTPDVNFLDLEIVEITLTAPTGLTYELYNNASRLELVPGRTVRLPEGYFAAVDEGVGTLSLSVQVPPGFTSREPVTVAPSLSFVVREGEATKSFQVSDPIPDTVVIAGAEDISVRVPQGGRVLNRPPAQLSYSQLTITDQDRNATALRLDSLTLVAKGTVSSQIAGVEITDSNGNLLAYREGLGEIPLIDPSGKPLSVSDDSSRTLVTTLTLQGTFPVGASLLLEHRVKLAEIHPYQVTTTHFEGTQVVVPDEAIFFGEPAFELRAVEEGVELWTTGETIATVVGTITYTPVQSVSLTLVTANSPYQISQQQVDPETGTISFVLTLSPGWAPAAGKLAELGFTLVGRVDGPTDLTVDLDVSTVVDTAGIELPFDVRARTVTITLTAPLISLLPTEAGAAITVDSPEVTVLEGVLTFEPAELAPEAVLVPSGGWGLSVLEADAEAGTVHFRVEASEPPQGGPLLTLTAPDAGSVQLTVLGVWDAMGNPLPFILAPEVAPLPEG
ncbi:hypothetical protein DRJ54_01510 [Candidatus Acetothermia bacterium]|nr:MAG: hypothetical protein DRJ54_01510 [Candidatus Acetothermia bacterium]